MLKTLQTSEQLCKRYDLCRVSPYIGNRDLDLFWVLCPVLVDGIRVA